MAAVWHRLTWYGKQLLGQAGQSTVEYGVIVCVMAIGLLAVLTLMYAQVADVFGITAEALRTVLRR